MEFGTSPTQELVKLCPTFGFQLSLHKNILANTIQLIQINIYKLKHILVNN